MKQIPYTWLGDAEVLGWGDGPFEKEMAEYLNSVEGEWWLENNLGKVMCGLTKDNYIS